MFRNKHHDIDHVEKELQRVEKLLRQLRRKRKHLDDVRHGRFFAMLGRDWQQGNLRRSKLQVERTTFLINHILKDLSI